MLKRIVNVCHFTLTIETEGPLLIKEGRLASDEESGEDWKSELGIPKSDRKNYPSAIFISLNNWDDLKHIIRNDIKNGDYSKLRFYIPGTSLRGVMRSHAEKIVRTLWDNKQDSICCDPFGKKSCLSEITLPTGEVPYRFSCVICKFFGNTHTASRIRVHDGIADIEKLKLGIRDGIAIDRFTGGVSQGANFKNQYLEGTFRSEITIHNFELWQLGLLAYVLRDFEQKLITIGFGKNKGFGRVKGTIDKVQVDYFCDTRELKGIGETYPNERDTYDFVSIPLSAPFCLGKPMGDDLYRKRFEIRMPENGGIVESTFWKACAEVWNKAVSERKFKTISELEKAARKKQSQSNPEFQEASDG